MVSLFAYDNRTFIVESFRETMGTVRILTDPKITKIRDLTTGQELTGVARGNRTVFETMMRGGGYRVFAAQ
jgi:hypothetical protein